MEGRTERQAESVSPCPSETSASSTCGINIRRSSLASLPPDTTASIASCPGIHGCGCSSEGWRPCIFRCGVDRRDGESRYGRRDMTGLRERRTRRCTWNIDNSNARNQPAPGPADGIPAPTKPPPASHRSIEQHACFGASVEPLGRKCL